MIPAAEANAVPLPHNFAKSTSRLRSSWRSLASSREGSPERGVAASRRSIATAGKDEAPAAWGLHRLAHSLGFRAPSRARALAEPDARIKPRVGDVDHEVGEQAHG